jgi:hypothetical protein
MKKINLTVFTIICIFFNVSVLVAQTTNQGQGNQQWKINGNIADENHYLGTKNEIPIKFRTNDIERFRITPSGDFGIGTSSPEAKLDVNGNVILRESLRLPNLIETNFSNKKLVLIDGNGNITKGSSEFTIDFLTDVLYTDRACRNAPNSKATWSSAINKIYSNCPDVNVGIGTSTPAYKLQVIGSSYSSSFKTESIIIGNVTNPSSKLTINSNSIKAFEINYTSETDYSFATQFNVNRGLTKAIAVNNSSTGSENFVVYGDGTVNTRRVNISSEMNNEQAGTLFMIQNAERKVFQVDNNGLVHARKMILDVLDNWPDYVFEKEYNLMPLNELEKYINKNKHLPNVPSEKEVLINGADLAEMNKILLQKIEELTLYLLEQNKKIEALEKKIK